jgi:hypothetical protein
MAKGEHPQRTQFYGACLMSAAFLSCWFASTLDIRWLAITVYVAAAIAAAIGFVMTFRDYSF